MSTDEEALRKRLYDLALPIVDAAVAEAVAAERERLAVLMEDYAGNYPEGVFPPDGESRDAIGGSAMRHAYRNAARMIRDAEDVK